MNPGHVGSQLSPDYPKAEGYKLSHPKAAWYWHKGEYFKEVRQTDLMDEIRDAWGSERVYSSSNKSSYY